MKPGAGLEWLLSLGRAADDFEQRRRAQETRNEVFINVICAVLLLIAFAAHLVNRYRRWAPFPSPLGLVFVLGSSLLACVALFFYLRKDPPYFRLRKYAITALEFLIFSLAYAFLATTMPPLLLITMPAPIGMLMVVLSGLRYSTGVVIFAGAQALAVQTVVGLLYAPFGYKIPVVVASTLGLGAATLVTRNVVASLIRLHREAIQREQLSRFLPPELLDEVARKPELLQRKTEHRLATVLFADIQGFTSLSERMDPADVVALLNLYFEEMTGAVLNHRGMLDKYIGDAIMAVFGVPLETPDHARFALNAAREIQSRVKALNLRLQREGRPLLPVGIGIHTGGVVAGVIGSATRFEYTVVGDTVNVASRLSALTRQHAVPILLSGATLAAAGNGHPCRSLGTVAVRGREQSLDVFTLE